MAPDVDVRSTEIITDVVIAGAAKAIDDVYYVR